MRVPALLLLFVLLMVLHGVFLTEAFYTQPGTLIQLNASRPLYYAAPVYEKPDSVYSPLRFLYQ